MKIDELNQNHIIANVGHTCYIDGVKLSEEEVYENTLITT